MHIQCRILYVAIPISLYTSYVRKYTAIDNLIFMLYTCTLRYALPKLSECNRSWARSWATNRNIGWTLIRTRITQIMATLNYDEELLGDQESIQLFRNEAKRECSIV